MRILKRILLTASATVFALTATVTPAVPLQTQVIAEAATMKISDKSLSLREGDTWKLKVTGKGKKKVKWSSSKPYVAKVSKSGNVRAVSEGSATIKAKVGKKTLKCKVYVTSTYDDYDDDDNDYSSVSQSSYFSRLKDYVNTNGTYNDDGEKQIEFTYDDEDGSTAQVEVTNNEDGDIGLTTFYGSFTDDGDMTSSYSSVDISSNGMASFLYQSFSLNYTSIYIATCSDYDPSLYVKGQNSIDFNVTKDSYYLTYSEIQTYANKFMDLSLDYIDLYLNNQVGFGLRELGFTNI